MPAKKPKTITNAQIAKALKNRPLKLSKIALKETVVYVIADSKGRWNIRDCYTEQEVRDIKLSKGEVIVKRKWK
jgi:hypothetical protein